MRNPSAQQRTYKLLFPCFVVIGAATIGGCSTPEATSLRNDIVVQADESHLWQLAQKQLKKRGFRLDLVDRRNGIIETYPLASSQWFEFWRRDAITPAGLAESSLQNIRRTVQIKIAPAQGDRHRLSCSVTVEKLAPQASLTAGQVRARSIFSSSVGPMPALSGKNRQKPDWVALGNDPYLQDDILRTIENALTKH